MQPHLAFGLLDLLEREAVGQVQIQGNLLLTIWNLLPAELTNRGPAERGVDLPLPLASSP